MMKFAWYLKKKFLFHFQYSYNNSFIVQNCAVQKKNDFQKVWRKGSRYFFYVEVPYDLLLQSMCE